MSSATNRAGAADAVAARLKAVMATWVRGTPIADMRRDWDELHAPGPSAPPADPVDAGGVPAAWVSAPDVREDRALLYLHGGGYQMGSVASHRGLMGRLSAAAGCPVLGIDYRLAPEHPFPAALEDAVTAWRWLRAEGFASSGLAVAGDSAGGGLALSLMLALRDAGEPLPAAGFLMSPWVDMTATADSYESLAGRDPLNRRDLIGLMAKSWLKGADPRDPRASPLFADLAGLPPLLVHVGAREIMLDDARGLCTAARDAGGMATLEIWEDMIHVFQLYPEMLPDADAAVAEAGEFLAGHLSPLPGA